MQLWLLKRVGKQLFGYDENYGFVVRAETEEQAREIAKENCADEGTKVWLNRDLVDCTPLSNDGDSGVILSDFNAG